MSTENLEALQQDLASAKARILELENLAAACDFSLTFAWAEFADEIKKLRAGARSRPDESAADAFTQARKLGKRIMLGHENCNKSPAAVKRAKAALKGLKELQDLREENAALKNQIAEAKSKSIDFYLCVIGALMRLLTAIPPKPYNQSSISKTIADYKWHGVGKTFLDTAFAAANRAVLEADKRKEP